MDFDSEAVQRLLAVALAEEVASGDLAASAIGCADARVQTRVIAERNLICAGLPLVQRVFHTLDTQMKMELLASDGVAVGVGQSVLELEGRTSGILTGERTALEFLGRLSGIATETRRFVDTVAGTSAKICCARLTTPGLRLLERYAMVAGGAFCREGKLILLTENHVAIAGGVRRLWTRRIVLFHRR
jgi:nicotinate-nucleotide pyrophosphorylase (carboxylating)